MASNLLTDQHITTHALMMLENKLTFTKYVDRQLDTEYKNAKRGATISVRKPPKYVVRDGQNVSIQDTVQTQVPMTLTHQFGVDTQFYSSDLALSISDFGTEILAPQIAVIANAIDYAGMALACDVPNAIGTPGSTFSGTLTAPQTLRYFTDAMAVLDKTGTPRDGERSAVINEDVNSILISNLSSLTQGATDIARQYREGTMGLLVGAKFSMDQNVNNFTVGSHAGTALVNGANQSTLLPPGLALGTAGYTNFTLNVKGFTANTLVASHGERFTLPNIYMAYGEGGQNTNKLQVFTVLNPTPVTADGTGLAALQIFPPIIATGAFKTVSAVPNNNDALTWLGAAATVTPQNLVFHKSAFTFASAELPLPGGMHMSARKSDKRLGISIRFVAGYQIGTDQFTGRFDVLCGWLTQRPECACVVYG